MAIDFPSSPSLGQIFTPIAGTSFRWNGSGWVMGGGVQVMISDTAPTNPLPGSLWWSSSTGLLSVYYNDGTSSQWVAVNPGPPGAQGIQGPTGGVGALKGFQANKNNADQTGITANTNTKITFATAVFNDGNYYDTAQSRWTPPAGKVQICLQVYLTGTTGNSVNLMLYKNGAALRQWYVTLPAGGASASIDILEVANGTDYYEAYVQFYTTGGTVSGSTYSAFFTGSYVG